MMTNNSKGLHTDFGDDAGSKRVLGQTSGIAPHERPGHLTPNPPTSRDQSAVAGIAAVRQQDLDDGIPHT